MGSLLATALLVVPPITWLGGTPLLDDSELKLARITDAPKSALWRPHLEPAFVRDCFHGFLCAHPCNTKRETNEWTFARALRKVFHLLLDLGRIAEAKVCR